MQRYALSRLDIEGYDPKLTVMRASCNPDTTKRTPIIELGILENSNPNEFPNKRPDNNLRTPKKMTELPVRAPKRY